MSQSEPRVAQWREPKTRMSLKLEHFYEALRVSLGDYDFKARRWARLTVSGKPNAQLRSEDSVGEDVIGVRETWCALDCDDGRAAFLSELYKTSSSRYGTSWTREAELRLGPTWVYDDFAGITEGTTRVDALALVKVLPMTSVGHTTGAHITDADILGEGLYWEQDSQKASHPLDVSAWAAEAARVGDAVLAGLGIVAAVTDVTAAVLHTESTVLDEYVRIVEDTAPVFGELVGREDDRLLGEMPSLKNMELVVMTSRCEDFLPPDNAPATATAEYVLASPVSEFTPCGSGAGGMKRALVELA